MKILLYAGFDAHKETIDVVVYRENERQVSLEWRIQNREGSILKVFGRLLREGYVRNSDAEFARYLSIANGSASEWAYYLLLANDLDILADKEYIEPHKCVTVIMKMLFSLTRRLKASG